MKISKILVSMSSSGDIVIRTSSSLSIESSADEHGILEIFRVKNELYADSYKGTIRFHNKNQLYLFVTEFFCANDLLRVSTYTTLLGMITIL
jgi:hypothetical protein